MSYSLDFSAVIDRLPELLLACLATIGLAIAGMSLATVIGVLGVVARRSRFRLLRGIVIGFVEAIRNTPFLVQIFFIFFALPQIGIKLNPTVTAIIALALNGGAYAIEIIRGGVDSIPKGQVEAGLALGLHYVSRMKDVILPQALKISLPATIGFLVQLIKGTSLAAIVGFVELSRAGQIVSNQTFRPLTVFALVGIIYFLICWPLSLWGAGVEKRLQAASR